MAKPMRVLSIDGGGIRGLIPASVLAELETMLRREKGPRACLAEHFDLLAGTSTGGLIACLLLVPDRKRSNGNGPDARRPVRTAQDIVDFYLDNASTLFGRSVAQRIRRMGGLADERYGSKGFNRVLDDTIGPRAGPESESETMLSDLLKPTVIPTYNATTGDPYFFKQHEAVKAGSRDFALRDVALATAAAPTQFETALVTSGDAELGACVDGGVFANNPAMCAYAEAHSHFGYGAQDMAVLSLGTGTATTTYTFKQMKNWGLARWIKPVLDMMLNGSDRTVDHQLRQIFKTLGDDAAGTQYLRLQADLGGEPASTSKMDNHTPANLTRLVEIGKEVAEDHREQLERFVQTQLL